MPADMPEPQQQSNGDTFEIAYPYGPRDITRNFLQPDGTLQNDDVVLNLTLAGDLRQYEDLLRDDQVHSTFEQRRSAVTAADWTVEPGADDATSTAAAEFVEENLKRVNWDRVTNKMLYTRFFGYGVAELLWSVIDGKFQWRAIKVRNRARFLFQADGRCYLNTARDRPATRIYAEAPYFWVTSAGAHFDDMFYGLGLAHQLYWLVRFKRDGLRFWMVYLEKFGMPTAVGKYKSGADALTKSRLLNAVRAVQTEAGLIIPDDTLIELLEAARTGNADYKMLETYVDAAIAKVCVGQTLTTEVSSTGGNRALGQVHEGVRDDLVKMDADLIDGSFNEGPVRWLVDYNFRGAEYPIVARTLEPAVDLTALAEQLSKLFTLGFKPTLEMVQTNWGADMVEDTTAADQRAAALVPGVFGNRQPAANNPEMQQRSTAAFTASTRTLFPDQKALDESVEALRRRLATLSRAMIEPILEYAATHTPTEMWLQIRKDHPDWSNEHIADAMARCIFVAKTWGRASAARTRH